MDTPYVALHHAKHANIYGSETTRHLLASIEPELWKRSPANKVIALDAAADAGEWVDIPNSRMRLLAIPSEHSDQLRINLLGLKWPVHAFRGAAVADLPSLPATAAEWVEGRTFAYLVDFLDADGNPEFTVYFQDSGTHPGVGYSPPCGDRNHREIDVALICAGGDLKGLDHPAGIIANTSPRHVVLSHWEDFFVTQRAICSEGQVRGLPLSDPRGFLEATRTAQKKANGRESVFLPCPTASHFEFAINESDDRARNRKETTAYDCARMFRASAEPSHHSGPQGPRPRP